MGPLYANRCEYPREWSQLLILLHSGQCTSSQTDERTDRYTDDGIVPIVDQAY